MAIGRSGLLGLLLLTACGGGSDEPLPDGGQPASARYLRLVLDRTEVLAR